MVITGAVGFIGSAVARAVQARGATIVALAEPGANDRNLEGIWRRSLGTRPAHLEGARMSSAKMIFKGERARAEIAYASGPPARRSGNLPAGSPTTATCSPSAHGDRVA